MTKTNLTKDEQKTLRSYDLYAREWIATHHTSNFWAPELDRLKKYLPKGKVLEIGSGGGVDAKELLNLGFEYIGTDISSGLIKEARKLIPQVTFLNQSVYELKFDENTFDGIWAAAVLLHIPKSRIDEALQKIHFVVRPKGIGCISLKMGMGEKLIQDNFQNKKFSRLFSFYSLKEFSKILKRNNFEIISSYTKTVEKVVWLIYFVKVIK